MDDTNTNPPPPPTLQNLSFAFGPPQNPQLVQHQVPGGTGTAGPAMVPAVLAAELVRIPPPSLAMLKQDLGMADKDVTAMTREEKAHMCDLQCRFQCRYPYMCVDTTRAAVSLRPYDASLQHHAAQSPATGVFHDGDDDDDDDVRVGVVSDSIQQTRILRATGETSTEITPEMLDAELDGIPPPTLAKLKRKLGMAGKDVAMMTPQEKRRLMRLFREGDMRPRNGPGPAQVLPVGGGHNVLYQPAPPAPPTPPTGMTGHPGNTLPVHPHLNQPATLPGHNQQTMDLGIQQYRQAIQNLATMPQSLTAAGAPSGTAGRPASLVPAPWSGVGSAGPADARTPYALGGPLGAARRTPPVPASGTGSLSGVAGPSFSSAPTPTRALAPDGRLGNPNPNPNPNPPGARFDTDAYLSQLTDELSRSLDWASLSAAWRSGLASAKLEGLGS